MKPVISVIAAAVLLTACSGNPFKKDFVEIEKVDTKADTVPVWYLDVEKDSDQYIHAVGTGLSDDLQFSLDKALHEAKLTLADKLSANATMDFKRFVGDNQKGGLGISSQKTQKVSKTSFKNVDVSKYVVDNKLVQKEAQQYRTYVQLRLDVVNRPIVNNYAQSDEVAADQAFESLDGNKIVVDKQ
jgi:PBP1b-binding outer membrane lipoprotein LpoB